MQENLATSHQKNRLLISAFGFAMLAVMIMVFGTLLKRSIEVPNQYYDLKPLEDVQEQQLRTRLSKTQRDSYSQFFLDHASEYTIPSTYVLQLADVESTASDALVAVINYPNFDYGRAISFAGEQNTEAVMFGDELPFSSRRLPFRLPKIEVQEPANSGQVVIQAIDTIQSGIGVHVYTKQDFQQYSQYNMFIYGLYYGVLLLLITGSLFLFYFTRDTSFLWYSAYLNCSVVFLLTASGLGQALIWTEHFTTTRYSFWSSCGMAVFITLFARSFIGRENLSKWFWTVSKCNLAILVVTSASMFFIHHGVMDTYFFVFAFIQMGVVLGFAIQTFIRQHKQAIFLILGYLVLFPGLVLSILKFSALVEINPLVNHAVEVSLLLEALVFSLGLGYKLQSLTRAEREIQRTREQYLNQLIAVREKEKQDMAVYLHNSVAQLLALLKSKLLKIEDTNSSPVISEIRQLADQSMYKLRAISHDTYPHALNEIGLAQTIHNYAEIHLEEADIDFKFSIDDSSLNDRQSLLLYRILQECINNVVRHANASRIILNIKFDNNKHQFLFRDDGDGFNSKESGFGIATIREYAQALDGELDVISEKGLGTSFRIEF